MVEYLHRAMLYTLINYQFTIKLGHSPTYSDSDIVCGASQLKWEGNDMFI